MAGIRTGQLLDRNGVPGVSRPYRSVLLVEDEATFRRVIARNLSGRGLVVREVGTAAEAVDSSTAERPDLMLLDINLPDRSGWDVMRELRRLGPARPTTLKAEGPLVVAARVLCAAAAHEMTATTVVGVLGLDDADAFRSLVADICADYGHEATVKLTAGSYSVRFQRMLTGAARR